MAREDFETEGGLVDDYTITVTDAYYAAPPDYADGTKLFLHWVGTTDVESQPIMDRDGYHPSWKCGDGWESIDGGKTAVHPIKSAGGKTAKFHPNSAAGELVTRMVAITSDDEGNPTYSPDPLVAISPTDATTFVGTSWKMMNEERVFTIGGVDHRTTWVFPYEYLSGPGAATAEPAPAPAPAEPAAEPVPAAEPAAAPASPASDKVLQIKLLAAAKKAGDHAEFMEAALAIEGVTEDEEILGQIIDETESGLYAQANA